jgi:hypothetical protein
MRAISLFTSPYLDTKGRIANSQILRAEMDYAGREIHQFMVEVKAIQG